MRMLARESAEIIGEYTENRVIDAAKSRVSTLELAQHLCGKLKPSGLTHLALCPLPDHSEDTPSFTVYPKTDSWYCFGCLRGGDQVHLAAHAWGHGDDGIAMAIAAADLLREFGHDIPERPVSWYAKQERQAPIRAAVEKTRRDIYRRRLFKYLILPALSHIQDDQEYAEELERAWTEFEELLP